MIKYLLQTTFLLFVSTQLIAIDKSHHVEITDENISYDIFKNAEIISDSNTIFTINSLIENKHALNFEDAEGFIHMPTNNKAFWLKAKITNRLNKPIVTFQKYIGTVKATLYIVKNNKVVKEIDLCYTEKDQSGNEFKQSVIYGNLNIEEGETADLYLRVQGVYMIYIPWFVASNKVFIRQVHRNDLFYGFVYGLFIMIIVYNLMLFVRLRENDYFFYSLNVFFLGLLLMNFHGHPYEFALNGHQDFKHKIDIYAGFAGIAHCLFAMVFLQVKKFPRWIYKAFIFFLLKYAIDILLRLLGLADNFYPWFGSGTTAMFADLFIIFVGIYAAIKGFFPAILFVLARVVLVVSIFVTAFYSMGKLDHTDLAYNALHYGASLEMILFAFAISYKIRLLKDGQIKAQKDRDEYIKNQNIFLEKKVKERTQELQLEKAKSDDLLLNILPETIADELKENGQIEAKHYSNVSVLFSDFKNFTQISRTVSADTLVKELNVYFKAFDEIMTNNGIEKIKTIGDAYMAAGGIPSTGKSEVVAKSTVKAALEMQDFVASYAEQNPDSILQSMRVGVHTGDVVAGVVGSKKFQYDIWGESVNLAARMESSGEAGKVNISESTYSLVKDSFNCEHRGQVYAKHVGDVNMYFVYGAKESVARTS